MVHDLRCSVTQVRHVSPSEEARSREPVTPPEKGGEVSVTARCPDGLVTFQTELKERVAVGDTVRVSLDVQPSPDGAS